MKKQLYRAAAATVLGLSLTTGIVSANNSASIDETGPDSSNSVHATTTHSTTVDNNNKLKVQNDNDQSAHSGDAEVYRNTTGGDATSGDTSNDNSTDVEASVSNTGAWGTMSGGSSMDASGDISNTGPDSDNHIYSTQTNTVKVTNTNDISVTNNNEQHASSGDAEVYRNTTGGDATTGSASNTNTSSFKFEVSN